MRERRTWRLQFTLHLCLSLLFHLSTINSNIISDKPKWSEEERNYLNTSCNVPREQESREFQHSKIDRRANLENEIVICSSICLLSSFLFLPSLQLHRRLSSLFLVMIQMKGDGRFVRGPREEWTYPEISFALSFQVEPSSHRWFNGVEKKQMKY